MLHPDCEIVDLDGGQLANWLTLALPPGAADGRWAVLVTDGGMAVGGIRRPGGPLDPNAIGTIDWSQPGVEAQRRRLDVDLLLVAERTAIAAIDEAFSSGVRLDQDYLQQCLVALPELLRQRDHGLRMAPPLLGLIPPLRASAVKTTFQLLIPDATSLVFYVFERDEVYASAIITKRAGQVDSFAMHPTLEDAIAGASLARDWRQQYRRALTAVGDRFASPSLGVFVERSALLRIITGPSDQIAKEIAGRALIIDPMPAWLLGLLGGATAMAVADRGARTLARFLPKSARQAASTLAGGAKERLRNQPFAALGFDPLELIGHVRRYYRPAPVKPRN